MAIGAPPVKFKLIDHQETKLPTVARNAAAALPHLFVTNKHGPAKTSNVNHELAVYCGHARTAEANDGGDKRLSARREAKARRAGSRRFAGTHVSSVPDVSRRRRRRPAKLPDDRGRICEGTF
jgi:hypothetical protein